MKKLTLDTNELRVETFDAEHAAKDPRGTVMAHDPTFAATCICMTDDDATCRKPTCPSC